MTMFGSQWLANPDTGYTIDQSIRFNKSASGSMSRTFGTPTDRNKFTYAFWMKPCSESNGYCLETNVTGGVTFSGLVFNGGSMQVFDFTGALIFKSHPEIAVHVHQSIRTCTAGYPRCKNNVI